MALKLFEKRFVHLVCFTILMPCVCIKIMLYQKDAKIQYVHVTLNVPSLLGCSAVFANNKSSMSFNFHEGLQQCELSTDYLGPTVTTTAGWNVYGPVVYGMWSEWMSWSEWSVSYGSRTRTRSCDNPPPGNVGKNCVGDSKEAETCNKIFSASDCPTGWNYFNESCYFFSETVKGWMDAKIACGSLKASLVKVENNGEDEYIRSVIKAQRYEYHWIGGRFDADTRTFLWLDGTPISFDGWGENRPSDKKGCMDYLVNVEWKWNNHIDCFKTLGPYICQVKCTV